MHRRGDAHAARGVARLPVLREHGRAVPTRNGIDPFADLRYVSTEIPKATTRMEVEALLPRNVNPARLQDTSQFSTVA